MARYRVKNWNKHQKITESRSSPSEWLKLKRDFPNDMHVSNLDDRLFRALINCLCYTDHNTGSIMYNEEEVCHRARTKPFKFSDLSHFLEPIESDGNELKHDETKCALEKRRVDKSREDTTSRAKASTLTPFDFPVKNSDVDWNLPQELVDKLTSTFPRVNVEAELKKIDSWLFSNPSKIKTTKGMPRFLNNWFSNANSSLKPEGPPVRLKDLPTSGEIIVQEKKWHD